MHFHVPSPPVMKRRCSMHSLYISMGFLSTSIWLNQPPNNFVVLLTLKDSCVGGPYVTLPWTHLRPHTAQITWPLPPPLQNVVTYGQLLSAVFSGAGSRCVLNVPRVHWHLDSELQGSTSLGPTEVTVPHICGLGCNLRFPGALDSVSTIRFK